MVKRGWLIRIFRFKGPQFDEAGQEEGVKDL